MHGCARRLLVVALLAASFPPAEGAEPKPTRQNIVDYFRRLPTGALEGEAAAWLDATAGSGRIIDRKNGYMRAEGDGGQPNFECALFRYRDDRPLLALCQGELEGPDSVRLDLYVLGPDGRMRRAPRAIFPVEDGAGTRFILPREGRTVIVRDRSGRHERRFAWDGERFVEEK